MKSEAFEDNWPHVETALAEFKSFGIREGFPGKRCIVGAGLKMYLNYRETIEWLQRPGPEDALAAAIAGNTRRLARKQLSWSRNQLPEHPVIELQEGGADASSVLASVSSGRGGSIEIP